MRRLFANVRPGKLQIHGVWLITAGFLWAGLGYLQMQLPVHAGTHPVGGLSPTSNVKNTAPVITKHLFENGLILLMKPNPANEVVSVQVLIRMGGIYESPKQRGLSKLMQLVLIKGTASRGAKDIVLETESVGASIDAGLVDSGYGSVSLKTTLVGFEHSLPVFLDILQNPAFSPREFEKEKQLMLQQLATSNDQPASEAFLNFRNLFYGNYPLGAKPEEIAAKVRLLTRDDLVAWYQKTYIPNNMVISIVGNIDPQSMIKRFQDSLGQWPKGKAPEAVSADLPSLTTNRQIIKTRDSQALFMFLGYPAPDLYSEDRPAMEVINYILGSDMGSRLFVELRDKKGLAYNVSTEYYPSNYPGYLYAFMATAPGNYPAARDGILAEFKRLTTELVPEGELKAAKQALKGRFLMSHETNASQGRYIGSFEILGLGYAYDQFYPGLIDQVSGEDIQRVARKYFGHYVLSVLTPAPVKETAN